ncbi:monovalent cation/H+ antiporter subunit D [Halomonas sp. MCCC 1A17488]|uniref:Monovalent cation/H+ antiporter subunit D n=1 Tax=Billgrantia sulfidoxydans TaxID=2733484 RepID=A0ABX7W5C9_9GAMM|nr:MULTISPECIES: monovalent cation/H+ antiporter subunit D [Halomonas]MCE8015469.1 monovalent cation/H+ antiporter subunit D [Halomonas sp. MCCC 1A17488]MCG3238802.1 monovalent cation/H+ antiporter subunit D [Halomonas sp. MCCC 1A17488]QPP51235.1 monovalent cation/H+ antiporter subunit D [Halomonas sp. SS10-MC5]QTP54792.1 monovalent cation/H+ antiporter subunit D [Halomonas sulfidoxydans]
MNHTLILPILLPLITGAGQLLLYRLPFGVQRRVGIASTLGLVMLGVWGLAMAGSGEHYLYHAGDWPAPFGIVLVLDRLSAIMLALTAVLGFCCLLYASSGTDKRGPHFHALFQFQLAGLNGAFLTGDLFNLFVFFEILLIASYALLLHGGGRARSRAGLHYVVINLAGSALFLIALGTLYGLTGTLNMADLALRVAEAPAEDAPLLAAASLILLVVFGIKAAILPLLFWLPRAYSASSAPVAALFAIMTKVGVYAILRVFLLVFALGEAPVNATAWRWLWPLALLTLALGGVGVLGSNSLRTLTAYLVILSVGTLLATISFVTPATLGAALFYLIHSTGMTAVFFLLADLLGRQRETGYDRFSAIGPIGHRWLLGSLFFIAGIAMVGLPPFGGFVSKAWILQASAQEPRGLWLWWVLLGAALLTLIAVSRTGSSWFWRPGDMARPYPLERGPLALVTGMVGLNGLLAAFGEPVMGYLELTALQLLDPQAYIAAVLPEAGAATREVAP